MRSRTWSKTTAACAPIKSAASEQRFQKAAAWPCSMIREVTFPLVRHQQLSLVIAAALEQGRSGRTAQEVGVYIANGVSALMPAPREQNLELRDIFPADRETCRKVVAQVVEVEITASERDFSVVRHRRESHRQFPKRLIESSTRTHYVIGRASGNPDNCSGLDAIEVGASHCRLEVERHDVACRCD